MHNWPQVKFAVGELDVRSIARTRTVQRNSEYSAVTHPIVIFEFETRAAHTCRDVRRSRGHVRAVTPMLQHCATGET